MKGTAKSWQNFKLCWTRTPMKKDLRRVLTQKVRHEWKDALGVIFKN